ncbi:hypothetical protein [Oleomonas cavernae]|uniref:hypothetical protein n=1 Tax=Oleomonas cavernae TaxID=2320859 RepID=UPI0011C3764A|nr:hypothetical protein [Oleomonas cavernae]
MNLLSINERLKGRDFKLWEYQPSLGSMLIRSSTELNGQPSDVGMDILIRGLLYAECPLSYGKIALDRANEPEIERVESLIGRRVEHGAALVIVNTRARFMLFAALIRIQEHTGYLSKSPLFSDIEAEWEEYKGKFPELDH